MWTAVRDAVALAVVGAALSGCSAKGLKTHPVQGKVELKDGDIAILTGSYVELMQEADPLVRASGRITAQGSYAIQTLHEGKVLSGAPDGKYKVRIVLGDESDEGVPKRKGNPFHPRYLDFDKSGLSFTVPSGDYSVVLSKK